MSIDRLAAEAGLSARTIRSYQARSLIQPPGRTGRTPFYTDRHLRRVRLVQHLQHRGLSLSAIGALLEPEHLLRQLGAPDRAIARTLRDNPRLAAALLACGVLLRLPDGVVHVRGTRALLAAIALRGPGVSPADALWALVDAIDATKPWARLVLSELRAASRDRLRAGDGDQDWVRDLAIPVFELAMDTAAGEPDAGLVR